MTETMIIIIVAGVVIIAFGVLCILAILRAQKETQVFNKRMVKVEKNLGSISDMVSKSVQQVQQTEENISYHLQQVEKQARMEAEAKALPPDEQVYQQTPIEGVAQAAPAEIDIPEEIDINDLIDDLEDVLPEIAPAGLGGLFEPEPVAPIQPQPMQPVEPVQPAIPDPVPVQPQPAAPQQAQPPVQPQPVQPEPVPAIEPEPELPQIQHFDYDIGKSGKKYTASELESLIRE